MEGQTSFVALFCIATAVAMLVRRLPIPYTVALVITGLAAGATGLVDPPHLTKDLLFTVFLPGLLFEAAFHLQIASVRENLRAILGLAVPGVVVAIGLTAALITLLIRVLELDATFSISLGFVFGALVAATDPIAVVALFRTLKVPARLAVLVEGESLLNDGTAVVLFTLVLAAVGGSAPTLTSLVLSFLSATLGGALIGGLVGVLASLATKRVDEPMIEISLTVIAAYGSFIVAEHLNLSGVIATVTAGLVCGNFGRHYGMSAESKAAVISFWEYIAFGMNSIVFLLIGFDTSIGALVAYWREIVLAFTAMMLARFGVVAGVALLLRRTTERFPESWTTVVAWGGIRGALSIVLALSLPASLPHRDMLLSITVGVVVLSILVQGITMSPLLRAAKIAGAGEADAHAN